jgi:hypothetical protein
MRATVAVLLLGLAASAVGDDLRGWYARGEGGQAVDVPFGAIRVGHSLPGHVWVDAGLEAGDGFTTLTAGLEVRAAAEKPVFLFARTEVGPLAASGGQKYLVASLGAGLGVRLAERWSARAGFTRSLQLGDSVLGPDSLQAGLEYRW